MCLHGSWLFFSCRIKFGSQVFSISCWEAHESYSPLEFNALKRGQYPRSSNIHIPLMWMHAKLLTSCTIFFFQHGICFMITKKLTQNGLAHISHDVHGIKQVCNRQMLHTCQELITTTLICVIFYHVTTSLIE